MPAMHHALPTRFGAALDPEKVLTEYPRPQMRRESYLNLNGRWDCAITAYDETPASYTGTILVPFSPESPLSGVNHLLLPDERLWYRRRMSLPAGFYDPAKGDRVLLHFGAVDQTATVFANGVEVAHHVGGFTPFSADLTEALAGGDDLTIVVRVRDVTDTSYHSRGKQKMKPGGIFYTPQSGIWQTVFLERVPKTHIRSLRITPLFDEAMVELRVRTSRPCACIARAAGQEITFSSGAACRIPMKEFRAWSPEDPYLYDLSVLAGEDRVESYFAMRKFSVGVDGQGVPRLKLNNAPYFHSGVLDQGYWSDGMLTAPSDEAMVYDIDTMKRMGFNMLRKHIKLEPLRWYYHCDRLGMLVWQDMPNGGGRYGKLAVSAPLVTGRHKKDDDYDYFARGDIAGREEFYLELTETVETLYNCPCVAMWTPFNEGWGQFDAAEAVRRIRALDNTRTIDHASGWHDQGVGDVRSLHVYFKPYRFREDTEGRAVVLSEFGGYNLRLAEHSVSGRNFGYRKYRTAEALSDAVQRLYLREILPAVPEGLCAAVYTQLSDVEEEVNGLLTYDRAVEKIPAEVMRRINGQLYGSLREPAETEPEPAEPETA